MLGHYGPGEGITALLLCAEANSFFEKAASTFDSANAAKGLCSAIPYPGSTWG